MVDTHVTYLDASAIVKIIAPERESDALIAWLLARRPLATTVIARVEVARALLRMRLGPAAREHALISAIDEIPLSLAVVERAATLMPAEVRSLDAIHLASAIEVGSDLEAFVTYDRRMADAARGLGLPVVSPA